MRNSVGWDGFIKGLKERPLKGTLAVNKGLYETIYGLYKGHIVVGY